MYTKEEQKLIEKIERILPKLAEGRPCSVCTSFWKNVPATQVVKILSNTHPDVEYMLPNLIPVCDKCAEFMPQDLDNFVQFKAVRHRQAKGSFNGRCIARGITKLQGLKNIYKELKEQVLL